MAMLSTLSAEDLIGADHPIRRIRATVDAVLGGLDSELGAMYPARGRPSVPPEMLLKASVLMALFSVRSERAFCERLRYDMLSEWFLGLRIDEHGFDASTFSKNRQRLLSHEIADRFFAAVVAQAHLRRYCSSDHFSVDGTLLEAWASHKSFKPKDGSRGGDAPRGRNAEGDFRGTKRRNDTHASTTDPEARLYRKSAGTAAVLCFMGHIVTENRNGLVVDAELTAADGYAERDTAVKMLQRRPPRRRRTVGADKAYDTKGFVKDARAASSPTLCPPQRDARSPDARSSRPPGPSGAPGAPSPSAARSRRSAPAPSARA